MSESSRRVHQAFGDHSLSECITSHLVQKFWSGDMPLCDASRSGRPQVLDDEALKAVKVEDLAESFQVFGETDFIFTT